VETRELDKYKTRSDLKMEELLNIANSFVGVIAPVQPSDRVAETLNERNLRYYISEGLVDRPLGKEGVSALYGYRHLLQILALKRLQVEYLPVKRIKEILPQATNEELESIALGGRPSCATQGRDRALSYLDSLLPDASRAATENIPRRHPEPQSFAAHLRAPQAKFEPGTPDKATSWERFILDDGIEMHIRSDRKSTLRGVGLKRIIERLFKLLRHQED
jgi:DNA-binding transcriptional MerR regulator